ncbi:hypothetical protein [Pseudomonas sp. R11-23-07]|nr:hypothetical protein [Pseudomonas sp. R11-23-07]
MRGKPVGKVPDIRGVTGNNVLLFQLISIGQFLNGDVFIRTILSAISAAASDLMAVHQPQMSQLNRRYRGQAPSHI